MKFRMVDRILDWQDREGIRGVKAVTFEEYDLKSMLGDPPQLPACLLLRSVLELADWLVVVSSGFTRLALPSEVEEAQFVDLPRPGEAAEMEVAVRRYGDDCILFDGRASVGKREVARVGSCVSTFVPLGDYCDPEEVKAVFAEICRRE